MRRMLSRLARHLMGFSHRQSLERLTELGFEPRVVYDIGAHHGNWTKATRECLPSSDFLLFEANPDNAAHLQTVGSRYFIAVLSDEEGVQREFYIPRNAATTGASLYKEQTVHYVGENLQVLELTTRRLDRLSAQHQLPTPDLIKLDVQGAELDVLRGAGSLLEKCTALIVELSLVQANEGAPLAADIMAGIKELGFNSVDVCKVRRSRLGNAVQMDLLFANGMLYEKFRAAAGLIH